MPRGVLIDVPKTEKESDVFMHPTTIYTTFDARDQAARDHVADTKHWLVHLHESHAKQIGAIGYACETCRMSWAVRQHDVLTAQEAELALRRIAGLKPAEPPKTPDNAWVHLLRDPI